MLLREHLEAGMKLMLAALQGQVQTIAGAEDIERLALCVSGQSDVAAALADVFEVLNAHAPIETRDGGRQLQMSFSWAHLGGRRFRPTSSLRAPAAVALNCGKRPG